MPKVLILDSDTSRRTQLSRVLEMLKYNVYQAETDGEAWLKAAHSSLDVIIVTDQHTSDCNALALLDRLQQAGSDLPLILFTSEPAEKERSDFDSIVLRDGGLLTLQVAIQAAISKERRPTTY